MIRRFIFALSAVALIALLTGQIFAKEITVHGKLAKTVEAGGWLIVTDGQKYLILNPQKFQKQKWFAESTAVEATGQTKPDVVTAYQEGIPFEVQSMHPLDQGSSAGDNGEAKFHVQVMVSGDSVVEAQPNTAILMPVAAQNRLRNALLREQYAFRLLTFSIFPLCFCYG